MKQKALSYLPDEMAAVVMAFNARLRKLRKLTTHGHFYWLSVDVAGYFNQAEGVDFKARLQVTQEFVTLGRGQRG